MKKLEKCLQIGFWLESWKTVSKLVFGQKIGKVSQKWFLTRKLEHYGQQETFDPKVQTLELGF